MSGSPTNLYDVMIALINNYKPVDEESAKEVANIYKVLKEAV